MLISHYVVPVEHIGYVMYYVMLILYLFLKINCLNKIYFLQISYNICSASK